MIDLLILLILVDKEITMYKIRKLIKSKFSAYTTPSFGAVKPALKRLEKEGFVLTRQSFSEGGKRSSFYSLTDAGKTELKSLILKPVSNNPLQFFSNARIKLACSGVLDKEERKSLFANLKTQAMEHKFESENISEYEKQLDFYQRIVLDNTVCEYNNLVMLIEGLEKENECNS